MNNGYQYTKKCDPIGMRGGLSGRQAGFAGLYGVHAIHRLSGHGWLTNTS